MVLLHPYVCTLRNDKNTTYDPLNANERTIVFVSPGDPLLKEVFSTL